MLTLVVSMLNTEKESMATQAWTMPPGRKPYKEALS